LVARSLRAHSTCAEDFEKAVEGHLQNEQLHWDRYTGLFAWTSATGPMAGLLGTILGLMKSFSDLAASQTAEPQVAMAGIADALLTTVLGILLAIPATAFFNHCKTRTRRARAAVASMSSLLLAQLSFETSETDDS
jgi:biopolymer transport protein ExbB/TolQ